MSAEFRSRAATKTHPRGQSNPSMLESAMVKIGGNRSLRRAKVIAFGEQHEDIFHKKAIGNFIRQHARQGDVVLIENVDRGKEVKQGSPLHKMYGFPPKVRVEGSEDPTLFVNALAAASHVLRTQIDLQLGIFEGPLDVEQLLQDYHQTVRVDRNKSLAEYIREVRRPLRKPWKRNKVFVIVGSNHLTLDPAFTAELQKMPYIAFQVDTPPEIAAVLTATPTTKEKELLRK